MQPSKKPQGGVEHREEERLVRVLSTDIPGSKTVYAGLTRVKGINWAVSKYVCTKLNLLDKKIHQLSPQDIEAIAAFFKSPDLPEHLKNRRFDFEDGENKHLIGTDLDLTQEFDVKRLRKIKSYRGLRHALRLPLRGQRTRSNFRKNRGKAVGVKKKNK